MKGARGPNSIEEKYNQSRKDIARAARNGKGNRNSRNTNLDDDDGPPPTRYVDDDDAPPPTRYAIQNHVENHGPLPTRRQKESEAKPAKISNSNRTSNRTSNNSYNSSELYGAQGPGFTKKSRKDRSESSISEYNEANVTANNENYDSEESDSTNRNSNDNRRSRHMPTPSDVKKQEHKMAQAEMRAKEEKGNLKKMKLAIALKNLENIVMSEDSDELDENGDKKSEDSREKLLEVKAHQKMLEIRELFKTKPSRSNSAGSGTLVSLIIETMRN